MRFYLDSSALVAFVCNEPTAPALKRWLTGLGDESLCSSDWCVPEVASAVALKVRTGQLAEAQADAAWAAFGEACDGLLQLLPLEAADCSLAAQMCRVHQSGLRAGDALHLAVALRSQCDALLAFDHDLNRNAQAGGLALISL
jgi:predicted nucleic acid-binding protein